MPAQTDVHVVLESEIFGRELFCFPDDDQAFAALRRLLADSRSAFLEDGIERVVGIIVTDREECFEE